MEVLLLIGVAVLIVATLLGALSGIPYAWIAIAGVVLGLALWVAGAIAIFRGPDNPDLGEEGWTIALGILLAFYVGVWLLGSAVGRTLRTRGTRGTSVSA